MSIEVHGFCEDRFAPLQQAFTENLESGAEIGASVAVTEQGRLVVDLWGGYADRARTRPWQADTLVQMFSTSKLMVVLCVLKLLDEGAVALDAPVAEYWSEFAQAGKSGITLRHILTHRSGLPGFDEPQNVDTIGDWDRVIHLLERQEPWFEPGTHGCYQFYTFGLLLGEVVRRVVGVPLSTYFDRQFAQPLGLDFHLRLDDAAAARVAELEIPDRLEREIDGAFAERAWHSFEPRGLNSPAFAAAENPGSNGFGHARSVAQAGAILAMDGAMDGRELIAPALVMEARSEQCYGICEPFGVGRIGLGFGLHCNEYPAPTPDAFHWGGYGGSSIVMDAVRGVSFAYAPNAMYAQDAVLDDVRLQRLWDAFGRVMNEA